MATGQHKQREQYQQREQYRQHEHYEQREQFGQFARLELLLGKEAVERLHHRGVILAGVGAVGSFALEALARAGIGRLRLIDCDQIKPSNINRQLIADWTTVGLAKTEAAERRVKSIWPKCEVERIDLVINAETAADVLADDTGRYDILIDAIDSLSSKVELLAAAVFRGLPRLSSMGAALKSDFAQVHFGPLTEVTHCPLSAMLRKRLRRRGVDTDEISCVWSSEPTRQLTRHGDLSGAILPPEESEDEKPEHGRRRSSLGSMPTLPGVFGLRLAHEAILRLSRPDEE